MKRIVILSGGGIKSAVCAATVAADHELILMHVDFGDPAASAQLVGLPALARRLPAASVVRAALRGFDECDLSDADGSAAAAVPAFAGGGSAHVAGPGLLSVLASLAVRCAVRFKARRVVTGLSAYVDASHIGLCVSPDRPDQIQEWLYFFNAMTAATVSGREPMILEAPLLGMTYTEIIKLGYHFQAPFEHTWTCEKAAPRPCKRCQGCRARAAAFAEARIVDSLLEAAVL